MQPTELREWLTRLNLSHASGADALAISKRTLQGYLYGQNPIPLIVERMAEIVEAQTKNIKI